MSGQVTDQVTDQPGQDQVTDQAKTDAASLGWRSALSDDLKEHDYVKTFQKPSDFVKAALDIKTEHEGLQEKMKGAIFKPGKGATDEEITAYRKAMGIPSKPDNYEFPATEGVEHDPKMIEWASKVFFEAGLSKKQGALISQSWDGFIKGLQEADEQMKKDALDKAVETLKAEWGAEFKGNMELVKRGWKHFSGEDLDKFVEETGIGNHPALIRFVFKVGQAMGEDFTPAAKPAVGPDGKRVLGMEYEGMEHFK